MWTNRVVWADGLFLRPHHLQQQERYFHGLIDRRAGAARPWGWGFEQLVVDEAQLENGRFRLIEATGILPDGTPFDFPTADPAPAAIPVPPALRDRRIRLAVVAEARGVALVSTDPNAAAGPGTRYRAADAQVSDTTAADGDPETIQVARLHLRLIPEEDGTHAAFASMPVARILEVGTGGRVTLDTGFVAPSISSLDAPVLAQHLHELVGILRQRIEATVAALAQPGAGGISEISQFLMLQAANRYLAVLEHLRGVPRLHPERLFETMVGMAGELSTFAPERRVSPPLPGYVHDDLQACFPPVMLRLRHLLSMGLQQAAIAIPIKNLQMGGLRAAVLSDKQLLQSGRFVLAARAHMPAEQLRSSLPMTMKVAPVERIRDYLGGLKAIELRPISTVPPQIPFHAGRSYFEFDQSSALWRDLSTSAAIGLHAPEAPFPGLELELWALRT